MKRGAKKTIKQAPSKVVFSHEDKIFWPKERYTKGDVINYYRHIGPYILPYLKNRPHSLLRHPDGIHGNSFFQKDVGSLAPAWVKTVSIASESAKKKVHYVVCQNIETLLYMANLGCIEMNPWNSRLSKLDSPDYAVLDLDPEGVDFPAVIKTALAVKKVLDRAGLKGYCKTSGKTGLHIYIPLGARYTYDQVRQLTRLLATLAHHQLPDITSVERRPSKRRKKVYIDFLQNSRGQTLTAPYSLRPWPGATVATPIEWSELKLGLRPDRFTIKTVFRRLKKRGDIFKSVLGPGVNLSVGLRKLSKP